MGEHLYGTPHSLYINTLHISSVLFCTKMFYEYLCSINDNKVVKGLDEYIGKHGKHFTIGLASDISSGKWKADAIDREAQRRAYYNVVDATLGDMVYLVNVFHVNNCNDSFKACVSSTLEILGDYGFHDGKIFMDWIIKVTNSKECLDLTEYI